MAASGLTSCECRVSHERRRGGRIAQIFGFRIGSGLDKQASRVF
jgi:hypothetical protein